MCHVTSYFSIFPSPVVLLSSNNSRQVVYSVN